MINVKNKNFVYVLYFLSMLNYAYAKENLDIEKFTINTQMKKQIMNSPFKASLRRGDGEKFIAYLYAENEESEPHEYSSCVDGELKKTILKKGYYYIYLYEINTDSFMPERISILKDFQKLDMNTQGADIFVLASNDINKSDVLIIGQFVSCSGNQYEAYGFFENNNSHLKQYTFVAKKKENSLFGRILKFNSDNKESVDFSEQGEVNYSKNGELIGYSMTTHNKIKQFALSLSNTLGEIQIKPLP